MDIYDITVATTIFYLQYMVTYLLVAVNLSFASMENMKVPLCYLLFTKNVGDTPHGMHHQHSLYNAVLV